jgi:hypothetical protein
MIQPSPCQPFRSIGSVWILVLLILFVDATGCTRSPEESNGKGVEFAEGTGEARTTVNGQMPIVLRDLADDNSDKTNEPDGEPSIAVNPADPREIAVVAFSGSWSSDPPVAAPIWKSFDGGLTWHKRDLLPAPAVFHTSAPNIRNIILEGPADQKIAYDREGHLTAVEMAADRNDRNFTVNVIYNQKGEPNKPLTADSFFGEGIADQPHVEANRTASSCANRIYAAWLKTDHDNSVGSFVFSNGPATTVAATGDQELPNRSTRIAIAPDDKAYILYKVRPSAEPDDFDGFEDVSFRVRRSDDCGRTWNALGKQTGVSVHGPSSVKSFFTSDFGNLKKTKLDARARAKSSDAWITTHPTNGDIYVTYVNRDASLHGQIYLAKSSDGGKNWESVRVTDGSKDSAYPEVAVTSDGVIGILYIDFTETATATVFRHNFVFSTDDGKSWKRQLLQSFDPATLKNLSNSPDLWGDYEGLTSQGKVFYGVFCGRSIGRKNVQLDPIFFRVEPSVSP